MRSVKHLTAAAVGLVAATIVVQTGSPVAALEGNRERVLNAYSRLPLAFVETRGPADSRVWFYAQASRYAFHSHQSRRERDGSRARPPDRDFACPCQKLVA